MKTYTEMHLETWNGIFMVTVEDHYLDAPIKGQYSDVLIRIPVPAWEDPQVVWSSVLDLWISDGWCLFRWEDEKAQLEKRNSSKLAKRPKGRMYQLLRAIEKSGRKYSQNELLEMLSSVR